MTIGTAVAILAVAAPVARATAAASSACTAKSGVTVIVDFTHFGRSIERGCAAGHYATSLAALQAAGFETAGTANFGDGFVCRIDGLPTPKTEACVLTPPAKASWSFYYARPTDAAWTYSTGGVLSYQPPSGTILAFAFGNYAKPGIAPTGAIASPPTTTRPVPRPTPAPTTPVTAQAIPTTTLAVALLPPATIVSGTTPRPTTTPSTTQQSPAATRPPPSSTFPPVVERAANAAVDHTGSGSPVPVLLTIALVAVLGGAAALTIRARRRRAT